MAAPETSLAYARDFERTHEDDGWQRLYPILHRHLTGRPKPAGGRRGPAGTRT